MNTNKSGRAQPKRSVPETRDFRALLDTLFDRKSSASSSKPKPTTVRPKNYESVIEKKLLDLVVNNRELYREKAPLPRSFMAPIYGKTVHRFKQNIAEEESEPHWNQQNITHDDRIILKQEELKQINTIVETKTSLDLLNCIKSQMDQEKYPAYYPKLLTKAIEHASQRDPYLAITIFELAKSKSLESYIFGCTTSVYNAMLQLRWETWRDVYGMLNLIEEMTVNGIEHSKDSRLIVRSVVQEIESDQSIHWDQDEKRACNVMKELSGKWIISK